MGREVMLNCWIVYQTHFSISYNNIDYFIFRSLTSDQQNVLPVEDESLQSFPRTSLVL